MHKTTPKLTTIFDLDIAERRGYKAELIGQAMKLGGMYRAFKATDTEGAQYEVRIGGGKERAPGVHASELSPCKRKIVYSIQGEERKQDAEVADSNMQMRFNVGHALHAMLQNDMKRMCATTMNTSARIMFKDEVPIHPGIGELAKKWNMHSSCDGLFSYFDEEGFPYLRVGLEIKTMSAGEFEKLMKPKEEHYEQTNFYMAALDVPLMWVLYYNKSNSNFVDSSPPHLFQFDADLWSRTEAKLDEAYKAAGTEELLPRVEGQHCRWCPFAWACQPATLKSVGGLNSVAHKPNAIRVPT